MKTRSPFDIFVAVALIVASLAPVWMIGSFVVDGSGASVDAVASRLDVSRGEAPR